MTRQVHIKGLGALKAFTGNVEKQAGFEKIIDEMAEIVLTEARKNLRSDSAMGGQGSLIEKTLEVRQGPTLHQVEIGTRLDLGHHLEFGTSRMAARPWMLPAIKMVAPALRQKLKQAVALVFTGQKTSGQSQRSGRTST